MSLQNAAMAHMEAEQGGSITVRNAGGYVARFSITYTLGGHRFTKDSGNFTVGVNKSVSIPSGSTDISLKVEEMWGFGWSTIFTKEYSKPVTECFEVYGTTLQPKYKSISC